MNFLSIVVFLGLTITAFFAILYWVFIKKGEKLDRKILEHHGVEGYVIFISGLPKTLIVLGLLFMFIASFINQESWVVQYMLVFIGVALLVWNMIKMFAMAASAYKTREYFFENFSILQDEMEARMKKYENEESNSNLKNEENE